MSTDISATKPREDALPIHVIATIGGSPAVLTEFLWALHREGYRDIRKIELITTASGRKEIEDNLLQFPEGGFYKLLAELGLDPSDMSINKSDIHVPVDNNGQPLVDIRTVEDDVQFATLLQNTVRTACSNNTMRVFACLAGGRKTMVSHLFSALQLYGRACDKVFHVLVSEAFENKKGFFFPTKASNVVEYKDNRTGLQVRFDTMEASVDLIDIPFIRLRPIIERGTSVDFNTLPYYELLEQVDAYFKAVKPLPIRKLYLDPTKRTIFLNFKEERFSIKLAPREFALLFYLAGKNIETGSVCDVTLETIRASRVELFKFHLCYHFSGGEIIDEDKLLAALWENGGGRLFSKTRSDLKKALVNKIRPEILGFEAKASDILSFPEDVKRDADRSVNRLLIPGSNIVILPHGKSLSPQTYFDDLPNSIRIGNGREILNRAELNKAAADFSAWFAENETA